MIKPKVIVICGPTASGKTRLAIELAKKIDGEIISADSMQIYKDMNIGTAKPTSKQMQGIKHYLIDFVSPNKRYSVADFRKDAIKTIEIVLKKGKVPIIVGGTGLYINTLIYNIKYPELKIDLEYRKQLEKQIKKQGLQMLYQRAIDIDIEATKKISENDKKRIMRILEIYHQTGKTKTELEAESKKEKSLYNYLIYAIEINRDELYNRINKRVDMMITKGLIKEVKSILEKYVEFPTAMQSLGYKEVVDYLKGNMTKEEMMEILKMETRRYAKRQLTWFRKNKEIKWINGTAPIEENIQFILEEYRGEKK